MDTDSWGRGELRACAWRRGEEGEVSGRKMRLMYLNNKKLNIYIYIMSKIFITDEALIKNKVNLRTY